MLQVHLVELDVIDCGIDHELDVSEGDVEISQYPWLGILYYTFCMYYPYIRIHVYKCIVRQEYEMKHTVHNNTFIFLYH